MSKDRRIPRYERDARSQELEAGRDCEIWLQRHLALLAACDRERQAANRQNWANVDPALRLWRVKPFEISPHDGVTSDVVRRFDEIKLATLGYRECTILTPDEDRCFLAEGPLGSVASRNDAERLVTALAAEFPRISFRIEMQEELLEYVVWQSISEVRDQ